MFNILYYSIHINKNKSKIQALILTLVLSIGARIFWYFRANPVIPQLTIYFLKDVKLPEKEQKVLVFSPHSDDENITFCLCLRWLYCRISTKRS
jgi:hypothetical protein